MIGEYANQTVRWKRVLTTNAYDEVLTKSETDIKVRLEDGFRIVRNSKGEEEVSSGRVFTETAVNADDYVDGRLVIAVSKQRMLNGGIGFYEVILK